MLTCICNNAAYTAIVAIVQECKQEMCKGVGCEVSDIDYINRVLQEFKEHRDVEVLVQAIAQQDTYIRDYYAYVVNDLEVDYYMGEWA